MAVITITSEFRTDSQRVASETAKRLEFEYIGDQLVAEIAEQLHISKHEAETFKKSSSSSLLRFLDRYTCSIVQRVVDREHGCLDDTAYYDKTRELVEKIFENENAVILGWGSQCILKDKPETFHVLLKKNDERKIEEIMKARKCTRKVAEQMIKTDEEDKQAYLKKYFDADWQDPALYDLIIDMGDHSADSAAELICDKARNQLTLS